VEGATVYGVTFPLITTASGVKMGKTAVGAVWLDRERTSPHEYYQFWINTDDRDVERFLGLFTLLAMEEVKELGRLEGADLRKAKRRLAHEATKLAHGEEAAVEAAAAAEALFRGEIVADITLPAVKASATIMSSNEIPEAEFEGGIEAFDLFHRVGLAKSRGAARRLIEGGGAYVNGRKIASFNERLTLADVEDGQLILRSGKKNNFLVNIT
jgi:tyrosyl-tRNA synthetase